MKRERNPLGNRKKSFGKQKEVLLEAERTAFTQRKESFHASKGIVLRDCYCAANALSCISCAFRACLESPLEGGAQLLPVTHELP